jgi:hypothetical protein
LPPAEIPAREAAFNKFVLDFCSANPEQPEDDKPPATPADVEHESEGPEEVNV